MNASPLFDPHGPAPICQHLRTDRLDVRITELGTGQLHWNGVALTRWHADPVSDDLGSLLYVRDLDTGAIWSLGYQPTRTAPRVYRTGTQDGQFWLEREDHDLTLRLDLSLDPTGDLERRRVQLTNHAAHPRRLELTSYLEVVLFPADADAAHPAFAKLFVQTERDPATGALLAHRRPRAQGESWPWLIHALLGAAAVSWETDRARFIGRGRTRAHPAALDAPLSGTLGNVLDPILALRTVIELAPRASTELTWLTGAAAERQAALDLLAAAPLSSAPPAVAESAPPPVLDDHAPPPDTALQHFNGYGGFTADGCGYVIHLPYQPDGRHRRPPRPWINVIANPTFGCLVSESGAGYTWSRNSQANRLTPWSNDPVSDPHGEAFYIRDTHSGACWSPLPGPRPAPADYQMTHGFGFSRCVLNYADLAHDTTVFVPRHDPLRILRLRLTNHSTATRRLALFGYQRLVLGQHPSASSAIVTHIDADAALLRASNPNAGDFAGGSVFSTAHVAGATVIARDCTTDRRAVIGRYRDLVDPIAMTTDQPLDGRDGTVGDPCFAQRLVVSLAPGDTLSCDWLFGEALSEAQLSDVLQRYADASAIDAAYTEAVAFWDDLTARLHVTTPEPAIDLMLNGWLLYQNLGCRIWARSAFYQSGGAYGYRDQLQDAAALVTIRPDLTRAQLLLHAAHQFVEGDVLHWWHPAPLGRGLRTRFADDLLWLPYVLAHYLRVTGDNSVLDERLPYLTAPQLASGQDEEYLAPLVSDESGDLYDHACRALDRSLTSGAHGLPLMGTGDWNDGMNRVGREGRGESVWMGFFLYRVLDDFLPLCEQRGDQARIDRYRAYQIALQQALETSGWDGDWYRRAYYDDGTPLGTATDSECRIDALAQAWAALSGAVPRARAEQALDALQQHLASDTEQLIRLLTPPFVATEHDPGYIKGYVAGVRENGGQYTHAACWAVAALAELERREQAALWLARLSPVSHSRTPAAVQRYQLEPYVVAADIYGAPPHNGRGGWSWYTGSAGWWYRVALESVLGLRIENGRELVIRPCIPASWRGFRLQYRLPDGVTDCAITVENGDGGGPVSAATLNAEPLTIEQGAARAVLPAGAGQHRLWVQLGTAAASLSTQSGSIKDQSCH